jgi:predicted metal-dependent hydrolase
MKPAAQPISVQVAGRVVEVWPKPSERARRVRLSVKPGPRVELTYPAGAPLATAVAFLKQQLGWLEEVVVKARTVQPSLLAHLEKFPWATLDERMMEVSVLTGPRARLVIEKEADALCMVLPEVGREEAAVRVIRRLAETGLTLAVERLAKRVGVSVEGVSVRDQTTRWGSCSQQGALSLNWRLVLLPPLVHDHVIYHELAHRKHMDHSDRFWNQLAAWDPEWKKHDRELTKRWNVIMDLGRA